MLNTQPNQGQTENAFAKMLRTSSRKIIAIGAGLKVRLRMVENIVFTKEPTHVPDQKLIDDIVTLVTVGTQKPKNDKMLQRENRTSQMGCFAL